ncbi:MAG: integration host factor subunit alpha [Syntrophales bacterium]|jgi:integration host factor subunit alpha
MAITKKELTDMCYANMAISKNECYKLVESFFDIIKDELIQGNDVMISGFGRWSVKKKRARTGRNPQTGGSITIGARKVITFKCSEKLRKELNGK